jgi:lipoteichoic acid synthase
MKKLCILVLFLMISLSGCYFGNPDYFDKNWIDHTTNSITQNEELLKQYYDDTTYNHLAHFMDLTEFDIYSYFNNRGFEKEVNNQSGIFKGYNYISIVAESTDFKFFDEYITPNIYSLLQNSIVYDNFYTVEFHEGATCNSEFSLLTGLFPLGVKNWSVNVCDVYNENTFEFSFPNQLNKEGYDTYYFHSGYELFYNRYKLIPNYGFKKDAFKDDLRRDFHYNLNENFDSNSIEFFEKYINYDNLFYANYLSYSGHGGYDESLSPKHENYVNEYIKIRFPHKNIHPKIKVYYQKIYEFDLFIGELLDLLIEKNVINNTIISITRDHHPYMMYDACYSDHVVNNLEYDEKYTNTYHLLQNDFILFNPKLTHKVESKVFSSVDVTPTMLKMFGVKADYTYFVGKDITLSSNNYIYIPENKFLDNPDLITDGTYYFASEFDNNVPKNKLKTFENEFEKKFLDNNFAKDILDTDFFRVFKDHK